MRRVMSVGQCGKDHGSIVRFLQGHFDVEVAPVATETEATRLLRQQAFDLVLVNRQFDADGTEGLDFIGRLKADARLSKVPIMLITNFPEYADQAVALGACRGFGKADLGSPDVVAQLDSFLGSETS